MCLSVSSFSFSHFSCFSVTGAGLPSCGVGCECWESPRFCSLATCKLPIWHVMQQHTRTISTSINPVQFTPASSCPKIVRKTKRITTGGAAAPHPPHCWLFLEDKTRKSLRGCLTRGMYLFCKLCTRDTYKRRSVTYLQVHMLSCTLDGHTPRWKKRCRVPLAARAAASIGSCYLSRASAEHH